MTARPRRSSLPTCGRTRGSSPSWTHSTSSRRDCRTHGSSWPAGGPRKRPCETASSRRRPRTGSSSRARSSAPTSRRRWRGQMSPVSPRTASRSGGAPSRRWPAGCPWSSRMPVGWARWCPRPPASRSPWATSTRWRARWRRCCATATGERRWGPRDVVPSRTRSNGRGSSTASKRCTPAWSPRPGTAPPSPGRDMTTALDKAPRSSFSGAQAAWIALCVACCLLTARMILISPQLGCTAALVVLVSGAAVRRLSAGIVAMWLVWLTAPFLRRLFALDDGLMSADPLALAPFVATFAVALVAVRRHGLGDAGARGIVLLAAVGFALGLPAGLASPEAAGFAGFAYTAGLSGFLLGYHEAHVSAGLLSRTLLVTAPALALYGVLQYFALPEWDRVWRERTNFV